MPLLYYFLKISKPSISIPVLSEKYFHQVETSLSSGSQQSNHSSRPSSPANSVCSTGSLSPARGRGATSDEMGEKILQHCFHLLESVAKFDTGKTLLKYFMSLVYLMTLWEYLLLIPSTPGITIVFLI